MYNGRFFLGAMIIIGSVYTSLENKDVDVNVFIDGVKTITEETETAFKEAEKQILGSTPKPKPEDPVGPNPDPNKCICKGTGKIVQGDGHVSPCPYHSKENTSKTEPKIQYQSACESTNGAACQTPVVQYRRNGINYSRSSAWSRGIFVDVIKK
jgi:hypothetical protein